VKAGARVDASGVGNHLSLPKPTLQAIKPYTSNAQKPWERRPQSATFFTRGRRWNTRRDRPRCRLSALRRN